MVGSLFRLAAGVLGLAALAYVVWFVPLGERTIAQHVARVLSTSEARELGDDLHRAGGRLREAVDGVLAREGNPTAPDAEP